MLRKLLRLYAGIPPYMKTRYAIVMMIFVVWMSFFDAHNFIRRYQTSRDLLEARQKKEFYRQKIEEVRTDLHDLFTSDALLEKFAREKYFMKRPEEELFVIVRN